MRRYVQAGKRGAAMLLSMALMKTATAVLLLNGYYKHVKLLRSAGSCTAICRYPDS
jgi:hypothetical protein